MKRILLILCGISVILALAIFVIYKNNQNSTKEVTEIFKEEKTSEVDSQDLDEPKDNNNKLYVDIKGEVTNPGLYEVEENMRVGEAIELAGGLLPSADTSLINLAKIVEDEMTIIVYSSAEVKEKYLEKLCQCQQDELTNDALVDELETSSKESTIVNINSANEEELESLDGIGKAKAKAIVEYREKNGNFLSVDDIRNVPGIGDSLFEKIKDYITV